ncbi:pyruvate dehydrogenase complex dihydrolipoamide acetyltransferase [Candidatus Njordibacter sp. Uisw_002]|uniref:pyruvate dehydrogenase complex dihydrolipoamide acetyltransferase n=1 Tax=Candidatus Njordibacter sp. Uisw_002 TaxID=3230971 RepID=UPI003D426E0C
MPIEIKMPAITPDFDAGNISSWDMAVGDKVAKGDVLVAVETDKAVIEVEAESAGILGQILIPAGTDDVPVHSLIGYLLIGNETIADLPSAAASGQATATPTVVDVNPQSTPGESVTSVPATAPTQQLADKQPQRLFASPLARRIADQNQVDLQTLKGRGPRGRILRADIEHAMSNKVPHSALALPAMSQSSQVKHSQIRKVIAQRLVESKQNIPHFYLSVDCEIDSLKGMLKELNANAPASINSITGNKEATYKLTINDFLVKAVAKAMEQVPQVNSSWSDTAMLHHEDIDISIAVSTDAGLITPIVCRADTKGLVSISTEIRQLAASARKGQLQAHQYQGGGFTISNLGMYGIDNFSAIINPPQACILAVGAGKQKPVVKDGELAVATLMNLTLSADHRVVDGAVGAQFLSVLKRFVESPAHLML